MRYSAYPYFTVEICSRGLLREPMRVIDVGVRGGFGEHWLHFGDCLQMWGFDPLYEHGVGPLIAKNPHPDRWHYLNIALGDRDEERPFNFIRENPSSSYFAARNGSDSAEVAESWQKVQLRRLDSLMQEGIIGAADFIKMDAETYEIEIVAGADRFFRTSGVFGVESETNFFRNPRNPRSHFLELYESLARYDFGVYDSEAMRAPRVPLAKGFPRFDNGGYELLPIGRQFVHDFLFLRDDFEKAEKQKDAGVDRLLKMIAVAEIHGLQDVGLDLLFNNRDALRARLDIDEAANWLVRDSKESTLTYEAYLNLG